MNLAVRVCGSAKWFLNVSILFLNYAIDPSQSCYWQCFFYCLKLSQFKSWHSWQHHHALICQDVGLTEPDCTGWGPSSNLKRDAPAGGLTEPRYKETCLYTSKCLSYSSLSLTGQIWSLRKLQTMSWINVNSYFYGSAPPIFYFCNMNGNLKKKLSIATQ